MDPHGFLSPPKPERQRGALLALFLVLAFVANLAAIGLLRWSATLLELIGRRNQFD